MHYTDEQLSAFLDGELAKQDLEAIEKALKSDAELARRLEALANVDETLQMVFDPLLEAPVPDRITSLLEQHDKTVQNDNDKKVVSLSEHRHKKSGWHFPAAIAASLLAGFFGAQSLNTSGQPVSFPAGMIATGPVNSSSALYAALSEVPSGQSQNGIRPVLSFQSTEGHLCREFTAQKSRALACHNDQGWTVISQTYAPDNAQKGGYATASSHSTEAFDSLVDSLMKGEVLSVDMEKTLIEKKWQKME